MSNFELAITLVLKNEGGYANSPNDNGGETKYGLSIKSYPALDIKNLTLEQAKAIYKRDFWDTGKFDSFNDFTVAAKVFDLSVNVGSTQATKILQRALRACGFNVIDDGVFGPKTLEAVNSVDSKELIVALKSEAAGFYRILVAKQDSQKIFLNGWLTRAYA